MEYVLVPILSILVLVIASLALIKPTAFLIMYFITFTGFFGFIDLYETQLSPSNLIFALNVVSILASVSVLLMKKSIEIKNKEILLLFFVYLLLIIYGTLIPYVISKGDFLLSIIDSKDLFVIFLILYVSLFSDKINSLLIINFIVFCSVILSAIVLIFHLTGMHPPGYHLVDPLKVDYSLGIHIRFATIMLFSFFILPFLKLNFKTRILISIILFIGIILQPHTSIKIAFILIFAFNFMKLNFKRLMQFFIVVLPVLYFIISQYLPSYDVVYNFINDSSGRRLDISYNRFQYIYNNIFFGYGFIHHEMNLGVEMMNKSIWIHDQRFTTVDGGYIDLIIRFGVIGLLIYLFFYFRVISSLTSKPSKRLKLMGYILSSMLFVSLTWSMFTYSQGLILIVLSYIFIDIKETSNV
ncbi:TPA: hypothetical protein ACQYE6_004473 [Vibrio parahaemolyticus]